MNRDALIIIGRLNYPCGSAPANRVHLYCKALKKANGFPLVINIHSNYGESRQFNFLDRYEGIPFYYSQKTLVREKKFAKRNFNKLKGFINAILVISRLNKKFHLKVLFFSTSFINEFFFFLVLKLMKIPIIRELNEAPLFVREEKKNIKLHNFLFRLRLKLFNEIIVISDYLYNYYSKIFPKKKIHQIPILVDMERFKDNSEKRTKTKKRITYVGYMDGNKDGLENLLESMAIVIKSTNNVQLELVGSASKNKIILLKNKVEALGLKHIVTFSGSKSMNEIPSILANSDLLVLARPNNNQAKAGFPTKLGEYLASGKPVVITKTGEIPKYLVDNVSAYIAKPDDIKDFAKKIVFALNDQKSKIIGQNGYLVANENFNYSIYSKIIFQIVHN